MKFISWLELAVASMNLNNHRDAAAVTLHPMLANGIQTGLGVTINGRWLRGHDGRLTVFDSVDSASRFLHLLKVDRFGYGSAYNGDPLRQIDCLSIVGGKLSLNETPSSGAILPLSYRRSVERPSAREHPLKKFLTARTSSNSITKGDDHV